MTQQYLVGELSQAISPLEDTPNPWLASAVSALRRRVEVSPIGALGPLADEARILATVACVIALERDDAAGFVTQATAAARLYEYARNSNLLA